jgi:hypothetical protein
VLLLILPKSAANIFHSIISKIITGGNLPHKTFKGKDAQLKLAIKYLKEKFQKELVEVPKLPLYPDKSLISIRTLFPKELVA